MKKSTRSASSASALAVGASKTKKAGDQKETKSSDDSKDYSSAQEPAQTKLVFLQKGRSNFDLEDLLRASAEILGKGSFGTSYRAVLEDGSSVVVKRLKDVSVRRKEFGQYMDSIGRLRHRNLVPIRAYYYSDEEKLLVQDYHSLGSLSTLLHGPKTTVVGWDARLKIAMGAARGLAHIHSISKKMVHGNIKSSNVLLKGDNEACISDYGLVGVFGPNVVYGRASSSTAGYRAPELETKKPTQSSDVYSFGVVLLELLTGKAPWQSSAEEGMELVRWVQSVVQEEWTSEVFDKELMKYEHVEEDMVELLRLGLACVTALPEDRPSMLHVISSISKVSPALAMAADDSSSPDPSYETSRVSPPVSSDYSSNDSTHVEASQESTSSLPGTSTSHPKIP